MDPNDSSSQRSHICYDPEQNGFRYVSAPWNGDGTSNSTATNPVNAPPENDRTYYAPPIPLTDLLGTYQPDVVPTWGGPDQTSGTLAGTDRPNWVSNGIWYTQPPAQPHPASGRVSPVTIYSESSADGNNTHITSTPSNIGQDSQADSTFLPNNNAGVDQTADASFSNNLSEPISLAPELFLPSIESQEEPQEFPAATVGFQENFMLPIIPTGSIAETPTFYSASSTHNSPARPQGKKASKMYKSTVANPKKEQIQQRLGQEALESSWNEPPVFPAEGTSFHQSPNIPASGIVTQDDHDAPGKSAFKQQDLFFHAEDIINDPSNADKVTTVFNTQHEADAYMNSRLTPEPTHDPTLPTTDEQRRALVGILVQAFKSTTTKVRDNQGALKPFENQIHDNRLVEWCMWHLLNNITQAAQARESVQVVLGGPSQFRGYIYRTFAERFDAVRWVLTYRKGSCKNLLETSESVKLADDPLANFEKAMDNKSLNEHKKKLIAQGVAAGSQSQSQTPDKAVDTDTEDKKQGRKRKSEPEDDNDHYNDDDNEDDNDNESNEYEGHDDLEDVDYSDDEQSSSVGNGKGNAKGKGKGKAKKVERSARSARPVKRARTTSQLA